MSSPKKSRENLLNQNDKALAKSKEGFSSKKKKDDSATPQEELPANSADGVMSSETAELVKGKIGALKEKFAAKTANVNESIAKGIHKTFAADDASEDDDEESSSDEEVEEGWDTNADDITTVTAVPTHSAMTIRNKPSLKCIYVEEENEIREQLKDAKALRKKLRKMKKLTKKSMKATQHAAAALDSVITSTNTAASNIVLTDSTVAQLTQTAEENIHAFRDSTAFLDYSNRIGDYILEQIKPLIEHTKLLSSAGKARRTARDKRIKLETEELDVADEQQYQRAMNLVSDFEEKDAAYKNELQSLREHSSSQIGQMLQGYLIETSMFLEQLSAVLRDSAHFASKEREGISFGAGSNAHLLDGASTTTPDGITRAPPLYSIKRDPEAEYASVAKTTTTSAFAEHNKTAVGIPLEDAKGLPADRYGSSEYARPLDTQARRDVDQFLTNGTFPERNEAAGTDYIRILEDEYGLKEWGLLIASTSPQVPIDGAVEDTRDDGTLVSHPSDLPVLPSMNSEL